MQDKKQKKTKLQLMFMILIFMVVLLTDFYAIINYPEEYILIAVITVILLIYLWGVVNGLFTLRTLKEERREEQYDSIFKSEKASYLMLKKYFEEIEEKIDILQETSKVPTEAIIGAQKGIAKVVINRNKENADAIMGSNEQLLESVERFEARLKESDEFIIENQKNVLYENLKEIMDRQQTLSDSIKDMETRLSQVIAANPVQFTANVEMPKTITAMPSVSEAVSQPVTAQNSHIKHEVVDDFIVPAVDEPVDMAAAVEPAVEQIAEPVIEPVIEAAAEPIAEPVIEPTIEPVAEPVNAAAQDMPVEPVVEQVIEPATEPIAEPIVEPAPAAEEAAADTANSDPNRQLSADEIAALFAGASEPEPESVVEPAPAAEEAVADTTNSDPNRQLSADEIAALFAGASAGAAEPEPASEPEPVETPASAPEPENPPVVDLNNTNRNLTPDEIAALFKGQ
ncbi:MAG: hypothetical protein U0K78_02200 [Agathobacter sp.]|uniref:hypothetical protein n=1 Tax=Agathobacter sp. TaxID=2021311 RepID=UPI002E79EF97|nr:hypothetical protein [Agathobacter sp.]MEE1216313.1 hypothetical protein [Agathobacter sp.]